MEEYCTAAEVLALTGVTVTATHCTNARYIIDNWIGTDFQNETSVTNEIVSGTGTQWLELKHYPIQSVSKVEVDEGSFDAPSWTIEDITDYKAPAQHGENNNELQYNGTWNKGIGNYRVTYKYGYSAVPSIVKNIAARISAILKKDPDSIVSETVGSYSVTYGSSQTKDSIENLLRQLPYGSTKVKAI
jgi:hypothetical protein